MTGPAISQTPDEPMFDPKAVIVPDENPYVAEDPAFLTDMDVASSTRSLSSSVLNYQYENGRRYHAYREGEYTMPNDEREQDRMDLQHHLFRLVLDGALFRAPVYLAEARILDLGTGTGIWAIDMADEFPKADVIGTDLSPIQPGWVPPNCYFEVDDFGSEWEFRKPFDFIHGRVLSGSIGNAPLLFSRIRDNLKPGGWVEMVDIETNFFADDDTLDRAPNMRRWVELHNEAGRRFGKETNVAPHFKLWMSDAGFTNVKEEIYKTPTNPWAKNSRLKEIGRYHQVNIIESMEAYSMALFTRVLGMSFAEIQVFFAAVRKEIVDRSLHLYAKYYFVYGQKPGRV